MSNQQFDISNVPFLRLFSAVYSVVAVTIFFGTLGLAGVMLPVYWKGVKNAETSQERAYFALRFVGLWCVGYVLLMFLIMGLDAVFFQADITRYFPTVSWMFMDWSMTHAMSFNMDLFWSLVIAVGATCMALVVGSEDENAEYVVPTRETRKNHIEDVMARYNQMLAEDPTLDAGFNALPGTRRIELLDTYEAQLKDMESRVRAVHQIWHKRCPID